VLFEDIPTAGADVLDRYKKYEAVIKAARDRGLLQVKGDVLAAALAALAEYEKEA
jgi:hypothetical protein